MPVPEPTHSWVPVQVQHMYPVLQLMLQLPALRDAQYVLSWPLAVEQSQPVQVKLLPSVVE